MPTTEIYTLSYTTLFRSGWALALIVLIIVAVVVLHFLLSDAGKKTVEFSAALVSAAGVVYTILLTVQAKRASNAAQFAQRWNEDRKSTRLNSSHSQISYADHRDLHSFLHDALPIWVGARPDRADNCSRCCSSFPAI